METHAPGCELKSDLKDYWLTRKKALAPLTGTVAELAPVVLGTSVQVDGFKLELVCSLDVALPCQLSCTLLPVTVIRKLGLAGESETCASDKSLPVCPAV